jgi:molecular chaperone GrpE
MSQRTSQRPGDGGHPADPGADDGAEETAGATLEASPELEAAMREAAEAVEARQAARRAEEGPAASEGGAAGGEPPAEAAADAARSELEDLKDRYLRLAADLENFRRRALKDREEAHHYGHQNLVKDLLSSVDNLERAIDHARKGGEGGGAGLFEGVELVLRELLAVLAKHGVTPIEALGQTFDPALHEAMAQVPDASKPANTIVEMFQRGYQLRGRLMRPARVVVSKPPIDADGEARGGKVD